MKATQKLGKHSLFLAAALLVLTTYAAPAVYAESDGSLKMKVDRIKQEKKENQSNKETELDKVFPELFEEETFTAIKQVEEESNQSMEALEEELFTMEEEPVTTLHATRDVLFEETYSVTASTTADADEKQADEESSGVGNTVLMALTGAGLLLSGGLYIMMQRTLG
ncbi:type VII secretion protein EssA [Sediminibacillus halophilus]|uniref:Type VII secretion protein EssA n=1 Tax=Sediminibacillus halophilus TaxID=482461 RepID=A0A1G9RSS0_9BACI|nr:type VII secretion protein EssA [Sediminibacillus halophilus]SDM26214.1 type VII secretion protein EssA [Sediminibacillus halophilus]